MPRAERASRTVAAPPDRVYAAFIDPEALVVWLPPRGMSATFEQFDLRPGGSYRMVLTYADAVGGPGKTTANTDVVEARFVEVVPDVRVVQAVEFVADDPAFAGTMTMTWTVTAVHGGTRVDITAADVPDGISEEDHATGLSSALENLSAYVEGGEPSPRAGRHGSASTAAPVNDALGAASAARKGAATPTRSER